MHVDIEKAQSAKDEDSAHKTLRDGSEPAASATPKSNSARQGSKNKEQEHAKANNARQGSKNKEQEHAKAVAKQGSKN